MKKIALFFTCLFIMAGIAAAQTSVKGKVTSTEDGSPVVGASIVVKGTNIGTMTDADGSYVLSGVPSNATTLVFSCIGMDTVEKPVAAVVNVTLSPDTEFLDETVVVAYGTVNKKDFTGSAASIDSKKLETRPLTNAMNALEGSTSGVQFTSASGQPGSSGGIRIRGFGSINATTSPLYIVDGVAYSGISNINTDDIESITILKDAASSALYGNRAANGVVLVTTKKGRSEKVTFNVNVSQGVSTRGIPEYDRLDAYQWVPMEWEMLKNSYLSAAGSKYTPESAAQEAASKLFSTANLVNNPFGVAADQVIDANGKMNSAAKILYPDDMDWYDAVERVGYRQEYTVSAGGASSKSDYYMSVGYLNEQGYSIKSMMERLNGRANINIQPKKWVKVGLNLAGTARNSVGANTSSSTGYANPFYFARNIGPIYPIHKHNPDGTLMLDGSGDPIYDWDNRGAGASLGRHIVAETLWNDNLTKTNVLNTRTFAEFTLLEGLKLTINYGYDFSTSIDAIDYENPDVGDGSPSGRSGFSYSRSDNYTFNQLLAYNKTINNHGLDFLIGHESYSANSKSVSGMKQGLIAKGNTELVNFTTINSFSGSASEYRTEGYLSRFNYNYNRKYYVSASFRRDASSRFYRDVRWGNFWSIGGSWRIDQEDFMRNLPWVDDLKFRASYGSVGNDGTSNYAWQSLYGILNNANTPGFIQSTSAGNKELQWEKNKSLDVALEYGLFRSRLTGSIELFHRISDNLLFSVPQPYSAGVTSQMQNIGTMYNQGVELQISGDIIRTRDFNWNMTLNASHVKNEITKLPQEEIISGNKKYMVGHSMYDFWLRDWAGVDPQTGDALYYRDILDENGNVTGKETTNDYTLASYYYTGSSIPKVNGSIQNSISFKGLTFSALLTYQLGGKVYDSVYAQLMSYSNLGSSLHADILNRWQKPGDITDVPRVDNGRNAYQNAASSRWLTDASYLSVRNMTLSYNLPAKLVKSIDLSNVRVFASVENLKVFCARKGMDPSYSFGGSQSNDYGVAKTATLGFNFQF